tara:strand:- start:1685 stop:2215 length:531 start_codon:yes stop_codon:yes gene_type:complete
MEDAQTPLLRWVKSNASMANLLSIVLLLFAAWAAVEIVSNVNGSDIPPTTGVLSNEDEPDGQRINNGLIIGLGAVAGTTGLILQLIITRDSPEQNVDDDPAEDEDIDGVVEDSMDESQDDTSEEEVSSEEIHEEEVPEEEESLEEEESTPWEQGEEESEDETPAEENKTPIKKRKF